MALQLTRTVRVVVPAASAYWTFTPLGVPRVAGRLALALFGGPAPSSFTATTVNVY